MPLLLRDRLRAPDVEVADLVADAARAGVQRRPHRVRFVGRELDEVVAAAERAELQLPVRIDRAVVARGERLELLDAPRGAVAERSVVVAGAHRNAPLDARANRRRVGDVVARQRRLDGDHPAADVDADRRRDDRALCGQHRTDRRAFAVVAVGHHRDVLEDERHRRRVLDLLQRLGLDRLGRREEDGFLVEPVHDTQLIHGNQERILMLLIREIFFCKPGQVRPLVEKFKAMNTVSAEDGPWARRGS